MMTLDSIEVRRFLEGADHHASKADIVNKAEREGASNDMRALLDGLPEGDLQTLREVSKAIGECEM